MENFYAEFAEILDVEEVGRDADLSEYEGWDSLGMLSTQILAEETYGVKINSRDFRTAATVGDIEDLINARRS